MQGDSAWAIHLKGIKVELIHILISASISSVSALIPNSQPKPIIQPLKSWFPTKDTSVIPAHQMNGID